MAEHRPLLLVVDDDDAARFVKTQKLRRAGFEIREAANGFETLALVDSLRPDLIVLDVNLPDINGFEIVRRIRERHTTLPAIQILQLSSTAVTPQDQVQGLEQGADVYLVEPVDAQVLAATVRALLRVRRAEQAAADALERERLAREEAEDATRLRDEFIAMLSHELRTPLNATMGWIWQLRRSPLDDAARTRAFDSLERNIQLQVQLISDLLDVSRISKGKLALELRWVDVRDVLRDALETARDRATRQGVALTSTVEPAMLIADQSRLLQIVGNLLTNAIQFTPAGGRVTVTCTNDAGDSVLSIRDTGAGIDKAFLPNVFDQFRQGGGGLTRKHGGLGLGLAVVRQLTELHGGVISVASDGPGHGAEFMVRLPREERGTASAAPVPGEPPLRNLEVVVALAGAAEEESIRVTCEAAGAVVTVIGADAATASQVRAAEFDALVTDDRHWAENDGALTRAFAERRRQTAVVLLTSPAETPADVVRRLSRSVPTRG